MLMDEGRQGRHGHEAAEERDNSARSPGPLVGDNPKNSLIANEFDRGLIGCELGEHPHLVIGSSFSNQRIKVNVIERAVDRSDIQVRVRCPKSLREKFKISHMRRNEDHALSLFDGTFKNIELRGNDRCLDEGGG